MRTSFTQTTQKPAKPQQSSAGRQKRKPTRREFVTVNRITAEIAERSIRLRFPSKPTEPERAVLRERGFWFNWPGRFWFNRLTDENVAFARRLETDGFCMDQAKPEQRSEMQTK